MRRKGKSRKRATVRATVAAAAFTMLLTPVQAFAAEKFDPAFYAATYADVVDALGTDANALYNHYITYGQKEGRLPYAGAAGGAAADGIADITVTAATTPAPTAAEGIVPIDRLANYKSLKKNMTDAEFQEAYDAALGIVQPLVGLDWNTQMVQLETVLRARFEAGMTYSTSDPHYNDPYGYLILGSASCAGCTRTTGLCLNMLGYNYEHVNENQWTHQWCRVNVGQEYMWICDPYADYSGPEFAPYEHPVLLMAQFGMVDMYQ